MNLPTPSSRKGRWQSHPMLYNDSQMMTEAKVKALKEKLRKGGKLTEEEINFLKEQIGREIAQQLFGGAPQINIKL